MIRIYNAGTDAYLGELTAEQLQFLVDQLVEEGAGDQDYYINAATVDMLRDAGAEAGLISILLDALGAEEALAIGLIDRVVPYERLDATIASLIDAGPAARIRANPCPPTRGFGSCIAATTRVIPAAITASAHGPVRPWCEHGSSVT